jgi:hypothetical protein
MSKTKKPYCSCGGTGCYLCRTSSGEIAGCYIATAVYGDYNAPEVLVLRRFRDSTLAKSAVGKLFIKTYYRFSPPLAKRLKHTYRINAVVRRLLDGFVGHISKN